jgi:hypothetical protein
MLALHDPRLLAALLLGVAACGGKVVETAGTGGASGTSGSGGAGGSVAVDCAGSPPTFPTFSKACTADTDCFIAIHQTDCCGSTAAIGLNVSQQAAFQAAEKTCDAMYPGCQCMGSGPVAEDGKVGTLSQLEVNCQMGKCMTSVP